MYRSILVPLDGSTFSEHALPIALSIARRHAAAVQLAHVHTAPFVPRYVGERPAIDNTLDAQMRESERAYLDGLARRLANYSEVAISVVLLDGAEVAETLHEHACAVGVDLVVMTTHARSGFVRFWLGNVADTLVRSATMPMLLIRPLTEPQELPALEREHAFRHILVPLDGSLLAEQALGHALTLGDPAQTSYTLLQAIDPLVGAHTHPPYAVGMDKAQFDQFSAEIQRYLDRVARRMREHAACVDTQLVVAQPASAILEFARTHAVDLIAIATHGRGDISRFLLGSVADKVVRGAAMPVLLYHPSSRNADSADRGAS